MNNKKPSKEEIERLTTMSLEELMRRAPPEIQKRVRETLIKTGQATSEEVDKMFEGPIHTKPIPHSMIINTIETIKERGYINKEDNELDVYWDYQSLLTTIENGDPIEFTSKDIKAFENVTMYIQKSQGIPIPTDDDIDNWLAMEEYTTLFSEYDKWLHSEVWNKSLQPSFIIYPGEGYVTIPDKYVRVLVKSIKLNNVSDDGRLPYDEDEKLYNEIISWDEYVDENKSFSPEQREKIKNLFESILTLMDDTYTVKEKLK